MSCRLNFSRRRVTCAVLVVSALGASAFLAPRRVRAAETPAAASATAPPRALLLPVHITGEPAARETIWAARIAKRVQAGGAAILDEPLDLDEKRCKDTGCLARAMKKHHADLVVRAAVTVRPGSYQLRAFVLRRDQKEAQYDETECAACTDEAAALRLDAMLAHALAPAGSAAAAAGNGEALAPAGPGANPVTVDLTQIRPLDDEEPDAVEGARPRWTIGADAGLGVAIAVGAVAVGIGAKFIYDQGRPLCDLAPPKTQCPHTADMQSAGIGLVVGGGVLALGAAAALAYIELRLSHPAPAIKPLTLRPVFAPGFAGLVFGGAL